MTIIKRFCYEIIRVCFNRRRFDIERLRYDV